MRKFLKIHKHTLIQLGLVILVLAAGVAVFKLLAGRRQPPAQTERPPTAALVEAVRVHPEDMVMTVEGFGTARAQRSVQLASQVSGRIIASSPNFMEGGFFEAGEALITIDPRDYEHAVQNAQATVAQAEYMLQQEEAEARVARREWEALHPGSDPPAPLVLREPQIKSMQAQLQGAKAQLATAKLNLERTVISLPFNGRLVEKSVDVGQYVSLGQTLGSAYGTDVIEVMTPLEDFELEWFDAPLTYPVNNGGATVRGPEAVVIADFAGRQHRWKGRVVRTQGRIDPTSRTVNVIAEVADPFREMNDDIPLTPGMFVRVQIEGKRLEGIMRVPRYAIRNEDEVWVVRDARLYVQKVEILRGDADYAYVTSGLQDGDTVVTSPLDVVTNGMAIRVQLIDSSEAIEEPSL
ncbi:MAG: efflux RND transporter periplasmic adaptor subunit [Phycisphaerae bacterium]|nr:efflux RND transporter periplasmic adaptor subunit [Phycisphaerae bacterium]